MKPILFNTEMVRKILDGTKTVTRRVVKPQPVELPSLKMCKDNVWRIEWWNINEFYSMKVPICIGEILYVRETFCELPVNPDGSDSGNTALVYYRADGDLRPESWRDQKWRPSIHMPKEAARIFLRVKDVRIKRLHDMETPDDKNYIAEGAKDKHDFIYVWDDTIRPAELDMYGWYANPWVWVIEFERISKEEAFKD